MDIDLSTFTDEQREAMLPVLTSMNEQIVALQEQLKKSGGTDQSEKITALETQLAEMQTKLDAATKKPEPKKDGKPDPQGTASELEAKLEALTAQIAALTGEREAEKASANAQRLAELAVEKKYPNLKAENKKAMVTRIAKTSPADEAAAISAADEVAGEWRGLGLDIKPIGADASKENKKETPEPGSKEARIEAVKNRGRTNVAV